MSQNNDKNSQRIIEKQGNREISGQLHARTFDNKFGSRIRITIDQS